MQISEILACALISDIAEALQLQRVSVSVDNTILHEENKEYNFRMLTTKDIICIQHLFQIWADRNLVGYQDNIMVLANGYYQFDVRWKNNGNEIKVISIWP